ncbi:unknown [Bacteroides sp. CAG:443]|nr:unknown [Bacteroides sp. CAG:443]
MSSAKESSRLRKFSDSMVGLLEYSSFIFTRPCMIPATSSPYICLIDSRLQRLYFTDSCNMIPSIEARRMPISSATITAVCMSLIIGFIPKALRGMLPSDITCIRCFFRLLQSSFCKVSPDSCSSRLYREINCLCSSGVKKTCSSIVFLVLLRTCWS